MSKKFDEIWGILKETGEKQKENEQMMKEFSKESSEKYKEWEERTKKAEKKQAEIDSRLNKWGFFWGEDTEATFEEATAGGLDVNGKKFIQNAANYVIYDEKEQKAAEIDLVMLNGHYILLIEVKYNLPKDTEKERENIDKLDAAFQKKIAAMERYKKDFLKDKIILKAFATRNLKSEHHKIYFEKGYLLLTMQNNEPKVWGVE